MSAPLVYIVIPCYNEEAVLPVTAPLFLQKLRQLTDAGLAAADSRILFVDDGSKDATWRIIGELAAADCHYKGISLSCNRGHQNALLAGLMTARQTADVTISIDCDGQDDINAMDEMLRQYQAGCEVVYGVRSRRDTDTFFKRFTAEGFYKLMKSLGVDSVYNHADYRLLGRRALDGLAQYREVNLFLRGMVPLVGFHSTSVYYERHERLAGKSHYPLKKMLSFALDGITSLSVKPLQLIIGLGLVISLAGFAAIVWAIVEAALGHTVAGWASTLCIVCLLGGIQLLCLGVIGTYVGKIYSEVKRRPRFIIREGTDGGEPVRDD